MKILTYNSGNIALAAQTLKDGGVVAHAADTCFGLAADLMNPEAVKKLQRIKGRDASKPMSVMFPAFMKEELPHYACLDDFAADVVRKLLPGPVTLLLPKGEGIPAYFFPESTHVGIRIPYDSLTQDLLTAFKGPLITTSANLSGESAMPDHDSVIRAFENSEAKPDLIIEGRIQNQCLPSTVILVEEGTIKIMRQGPMTEAQIRSILGL